LVGSFSGALYGLHYYQGVADEFGPADRFFQPTRGASFTTADRFVFVMEQTLGHITHARNLSLLLDGVERADVRFVPIEMSERRSRVPGFSNWTVNAGQRLGARWPLCRALDGVWTWTPSSCTPRYRQCSSVASVGGRG